MFNYVDYLGQKLNIIAVKNGFENNIEVYEEQAFLGIGEPVPNTIYVVLRFLSAELQQTGIKEQPIQATVMSEQNSLEVARAVLLEFAQAYNWKDERIGDVYMKQSYNTPITLNNFEKVAYGFRSVLYIAGTLQLMENVVDLEDFKINGISVKPSATQINYTMQGNTQQIPPNFLATTEKTVATFGLTITLPLTSNFEDSEGGNFLTPFLMIALGEISGNHTISVSFKIFGVSFNKNMKCVNVTIPTAPNAIPTITIGLLL